MKKTVVFAVLFVALLAAFALSSCKLPDDDYFIPANQEQTAAEEQPAVVVGESETIPTATATATPAPTATPTATPEPTEITTIEAIEERFGLTLNRNFSGKEVPIHILSFKLDEAGENIILWGYTAKSWNSVVGYTKEEYQEILETGYIDLTFSECGWIYWTICDSYADMVQERLYVLGDNDWQNSIRLSTDQTGDAEFYLYNTEYMYSTKPRQDYELYSSSGRVMMVDEYVELTIPVDLCVFEFYLDVDDSISVTDDSHGTALKHYNHYMDTIDNKVGEWQGGFFNNFYCPTVTAEDGLVTQMLDEENQSSGIYYIFAMKDAG